VQSATLLNETLKCAKKRFIASPRIIIIAQNGVVFNLIISHRTAETAPKWIEQVIEELCFALNQFKKLCTRFPTKIYDNYCNGVGTVFYDLKLNSLFFGKLFVLRNQERESASHIAEILIWFQVNLVQANVQQMGSRVDELQAEFLNASTKVNLSCRNIILPLQTQN
jgi:hypothetical protein